jgi:hypothetical protein
MYAAAREARVMMPCLQRPSWTGEAAGMSELAEIRYRPEFIDVLQAYRLSTARRRRRAVLINGAIVLLIDAVFFFGVPELPVWLRAAVVAGSIAGGIIVPNLLGAWLFPRRIRRIYRQQRTLHLDYVVRWDADAMVAASENGHNVTPWRDVLRWREDAHTVLVYHSDLLFQFIPKRAASEAQLASLRGAAEAAGVFNRSSGSRGRAARA